MVIMLYSRLCAFILLGNSRVELKGKRKQWAWSWNWMCVGKLVCLAFWVWWTKQNIWESTSIPVSIPYAMYFPIKVAGAAFSCEIQPGMQIRQHQSVCLYTLMQFSTYVIRMLFDKLIVAHVHTIHYIFSMPLQLLLSIVMNQHHALLSFLIEHNQNHSWCVVVCIPPSTYSWKLGLDLRCPAFGHGGYLRALPA